MFQSIHQARGSQLEAVFYSSDIWHVGNIGDSHGWGGGTGIYWVEATDAAKRPTGHRAASTTQNSPAPNINSITVEKPCVKSIANNLPPAHHPSLVVPIPFQTKLTSLDLKSVPSLKCPFLCFHSNVSILPPLSLSRHSIWYLYWTKRLGLVPGSITNCLSNHWHVTAC